MIKGIGTDILQIERIEKTLVRSPKIAERVLTANEMQTFKSSSQPSRFFAKRFAAKEAVVKALGTGIGNGVGWQHIEINNDELGKPLITLCDGALQRAELLGAQHYHLSLSDELDYVVAMVVIE
jgi:holo-[acyl-carrier protein] synthase